MSDLLPGPHQLPLKTKLRAIFAQKTRDEWVQFARERDCCLEPVLTAEEAAADEHLVARKMFFEMASAWGPIQQMRTPLTPVDREHTPPPSQGEHTEAILREGGLSSDDIAAMRTEGAIR